jgi:glycerophosphoryl diester phosphodiesterase
MGREQSFAAVEFDVKLAQDNVAVLMHDATLERTTSGSGFVADQGIARLETLDAGGWHSEAYRGERIPRFTAVAKYLHATGLMANVEIKPCPGREAETGRVVAELCSELWRDRLVKPLLSSFSIEALRAARAATTDLPIGLLVPVPAEANLALLEELGAVSIHCDHENITAHFVTLFHRRGYRVMTYTVNEPSRAAILLDMGVDGIFTDNLTLMAKHFPAQLCDAGRPPRQTMSADVIWPLIAPPMG